MTLRMPRGRWRELWPVLAFVPFTTLMLFLDSRAVARAGYDGQLLALRGARRLLESSKFKVQSWKLETRNSKLETRSLCDA